MTKTQVSFNYFGSVLSSHFNPYPESFAQNGVGRQRLAHQAMKHERAQSYSSCSPITRHLKLTYLSWVSILSFVVSLKFVLNLRFSFASR